MKTFTHRTLRVASLLVATVLALGGFGSLANAGTTAPAADSKPAVTIVYATLSDAMTITLDRYTVPAGYVRFLVTNAGASTHELVVLKTGLAADKLEANPDVAGKVAEEVHMGETGDVAGGRFNGLELQLGPGSYVIICNEIGHYTAGMRIAFTVIQPTVNVSLDDLMTITLDQTIYAGPVVFGVTNRGAVTHEFVVLDTKLAPSDMQDNPEEAGKVVEDGNIGETHDISAGRFSGLGLDLAPGVYMVICNEPGHFAAGMHFQLTVLPLPGGDE